MFDQPIQVDWDNPSLEIIKQTVLKKYCSFIHGQPVLEDLTEAQKDLSAADLEGVRCNIFQTGFESRVVGALDRRTNRRPKSRRTII